MERVTIKLLVVLFAFSFISGIAAYTVNGKYIVDPTGRNVRIRGADRCSFEWSPTGQYASQSDYNLMASWGFNVVRLPMNQDFWLVGSSTYSSGYRQQIANQVAMIKSANMGVILDLHWSDLGNLQISPRADQQNMADLNSITFWTQVATAYSNDPWVMFELYNEPHDVDANTWRNGGVYGGQMYAGMQQMYNAVRATGAGNVVIVNGLNWAYDLSMVGGGYAISGINIAYATHPYDYPGKQSDDWLRAFGYLARTAPVIMTEFGQYCATGDYVSQLLSYAEANGIHWTAWAWWVQGCEFPSIISDWSGTPTSVGAVVKAALPPVGTWAGPVSAPSTSNPSSSSQQGSPTLAPTIAPTFPPVTAATGGLSIFVNSLLNQWQSWSWGSVTIGSSITLGLSAYSGIYLHTSSPFAIGTYGYLQFAVYSSVSNPTIVVRVYDNSASPAQIGSTVSMPTTIQANTLVIQTVPVSSFTTPNTIISGFAIMYNQPGTSSASVQVSSVAFLPSGSSTPATIAPTAKAATAAPPTASPATVAPTTKPATAAPPTAPPATIAPTAKAATPAPPSQPQTGATSAPTGGCTAASVAVAQTLVSSWTSGVQTTYQYSVAIQNNCPSKSLASLTLQANNWNPSQFWNANVAGGNLLTFQNIVSYKVAAGAIFTDFGYQNIGGAATFTVSAATFV